MTRFVEIIEVATNRTPTFIENDFSYMVLTLLSIGFLVYYVCCRWALLDGALGHWMRNMGAAHTFDTGN